MAKVFVMDHPLVQHKITMLRDKNTSTKDFRELAEEISLLMAYEVTRDLPLEDIEVETPICKTVAKTVSGRSVGIVPILRAGLGMVNGMLKLVPNAKVGHIGLYRDPKTLKPVEYYCKLPADATDRTLIVVDPMLAFFEGQRLHQYQILLSHRGAAGACCAAKSASRRRYFHRCVG